MERRKNKKRVNLSRELSAYSTHRVLLAENVIWKWVITIFWFDAKKVNEMRRKSHKSIVLCLLALAHVLAVDVDVNGARSTLKVLSQADLNRSDLATRCHCTWKLIQHGMTTRAKRKLKNRSSHLRLPGYLIVKLAFNWSCKFLWIVQRQRPLLPLITYMYT